MTGAEGKGARRIAHLILAYPSQALGTCQLAVVSRERDVKLEVETNSLAPTVRCLTRINIDAILRWCIGIRTHDSMWRQKASLILIFSTLRLVAVTPQSRSFCILDY